MQRFLSILKSNNGALFLGIICASIGSALFIPGAGIVTTLPFVVLLTALPTFICEKYYHLPAMFFAVTYFFCFAKDVPLKYPDVLGGYSLYIAFWAFGISAATSLACFVLKKALKNKKRQAAPILLSVLLFAGAMLCTNVINGTPFGWTEAKSKILGYADDNFTVEELDIGGVYYNPKGKYYACDAQISGTVDKGSFIYKDTVTNTLNDLAVDYAGLGKSIEIGKLLRKAFPNESFTVTPNKRGFDGIKVSFKDTSNILPLINYTVTIHSEETAKSFVEKAEAYVAVISASDLKCGTITVVGGAKQKLYYTISVDTTAPHTNLGKFLRIYSTTPLPQNSVISAHKTFK